jgi:hypothetical protein
MAGNKDDVVSYKSKEYLEKVLTAHSTVLSVKALSHRVYEVMRRGKSPLVVLLTGKYLFSVADYADVRSSNRT